MSVSLSEDVKNGLVDSPAEWGDDQLTRDILKPRLEQFQQHLAAAFDAGEPVEPLIDARTLFIDRLLRRLWRFFGFDEMPAIALVAVGGYGRAELHPLSDIDVLILSRQPLDEQAAQHTSDL